MTKGIIKVSIEMMLPNLTDPKKADQARLDPLIFIMEDHKDPKHLPPGIMSDVKKLITMGFEYARARVPEYPTSLLYEPAEGAKEPQREDPKLVEEMCPKCQFVKSQCFCEGS